MPLSRAIFAHKLWPRSWWLLHSWISLRLCSGLWLEIHIVQIDVNAHGWGRYVSAKMLTLCADCTSRRAPIIDMLVLATRWYGMDCGQEMGPDMLSAWVTSNLTRVMVFCLVPVGTWVTIITHAPRLRGYADRVPCKPWETNARTNHWRACHIQQLKQTECGLKQQHGEVLCTLLCILSTYWLDFGGQQPQHCHLWRKCRKASNADCSRSTTSAPMGLTSKSILYNTSFPPVDIDGNI